MMPRQKPLHISPEQSPMNSTFPSFGGTITPVSQEIFGASILTGQKAPVQGKKRKWKKTSPKGDGSESPAQGGRWLPEEDQRLRDGVAAVGAKNWKKVSEMYMDSKRTDVQCLHRWQKVLRPGLVKGPWTKDEDHIIIQCMNSGITKWSEVANKIPGRIGKQCRERWFNHLVSGVVCRTCT
jgi:hypothetical protein